MKPTEGQLHFIYIFTSLELVEENIGTLLTSGYRNFQKVKQLHPKVLVTKIF